MPPGRQPVQRPSGRYYVPTVQVISPDLGEPEPSFSMPTDGRDLGRGSAHTEHSVLAQTRGCGKSGCLPLAARLDGPFQRHSGRPLAVSAPAPSSGRSGQGAATLRGHDGWAGWHARLGRAWCRVRHRPERGGPDVAGPDVLRSRRAVLNRRRRGPRASPDRRRPRLVPDDGLPAGAGRDVRGFGGIVYSGVWAACRRLPARRVQLSTAGLILRQAGDEPFTHFINGGHDRDVWRTLLRDFLTRVAFKALATEPASEP